MKKKWFYYPSFLSKQGLLFDAKKTFWFPGAKCPCPKKSFIAVNLFKINSKYKNKLTGQIVDYGTNMKSWAIVHHLIEYGHPGIYIYFRSAANSIISKRNKFKQLRLELN